MIPFLNSYWDVFDRNVLFEVNVQTSRQYHETLRRLAAELGIRYVARNLHLWGNEARTVLAERVAVTKMDYREFQAAVRRQKTQMFDSLRKLRMSQIRGAPLIISGLRRPRDLQLVKTTCADRMRGELYGLGSALDAGQQWNVKTPPLKILGVQGGGRALLRLPGMS